ncbi:MAG TPA: winged helix-turn-helix transcriptional regulator [Chloroflexi bacterium]|nr:winged helix-turn-helix transcriptional regulator [Chloroflexota bacterium]
MAGAAQFEDAFTNLSAEYEGEWLSAAYVEPANFGAIASMRSMVIAAEAGAGKSALRIILVQRSTNAAGPHHLAVEWRFTPALEPLHGSHLVRAYTQQVFGACAESLLRVIVDWPQRFVAAHAWVRTSCFDFIHNALGATLERTMMRTGRNAAPEAAGVLQALREHAPLASPLDQLADVTAELAEIVRELGMTGVWVLVDRLEPWLSADADQTAQAFRSLLETLTLLETPGFVFKIFAPPELQARLSGVSGLGRRRLDLLPLTWQVDELKAIVSARLRLLLGRDDIDLDSLCASSLLLERLQQFGGANPRGWLELARPFATAALAAPAALPLTAQQCHELHRRHPPYLRMDLSTDQAFLGERELSELTPTARRLLRYLYQQQGRAVSRAELYFRAQRNLPEVPAGAELGFDGSEDWTAQLDTALWRLRKQVEPDPRTPLYIITTATGVRLQHVR